MNQIEKEELDYLAEINKKIEDELKKINDKILKHKQDIKADTMFRGEAKSDMDYAEKIFFRQNIEEKVLRTDRIVRQKYKLEKTKNVPYFGRFDFLKDNKKNQEKIYLGINNFYDESSPKPLIYDWRSPISSLFYNFELGKASYQAPEKTVEVEIILKRQFKIRDSKMEYVIESAVNIMDDVLQKELSQNSDQKMKNIVSTIERDQNLIIRNEDDDILIIQGVAGSGKTSIALHRIAFLLYRFKEKIKSSDILIISPNKVFSDYISNVLPELGEEPIFEIQMESIARELLTDKYKFVSAYQQNLDILKYNNPSLIKRINYKSSYEFIEKLDTYIEEIKANIFSSKYVKVAECLVPNWLFDEAYIKFKDYNKKDCVHKILDYTTKKINFEYHYQLNKDEKLELKKHIEKMHQGNDLLMEYKNFFKYINREDLFKLTKDKRLEYNDVFPLIYLQIKIGKKSHFARNFKHLIIDEMQDYNFMQYLVINLLFKTKKTILGDVNQSINPYNNIDVENLRKIFTPVKFIELNKSYRSSYEIMEFVSKIIKNDKLETIKRHGKRPEVLKFNSNNLEKEAILSILKIQKKETKSIALIFKTQEEANDFFAYLEDNNIKANLFKEESLNFKQGIVVCTAYMAKGLEFDQVIVPYVNENNYQSELDRKLLYVACTRAMHSLIITYSHKLSKLIKQNIIS